MKTNMPRLSKVDIDVINASKNLVDNPAFNVVFDYLVNSATHSLVNGSLDKASDNLLNLKTLIAVTTAVESLSNAPIE